MKDTLISNVTVANLNAELIMPFTIATGSHKSLENLLVKIETNDGHFGYGEAAIASHITGETVEKTKANLQKICEKLLGQDVSNYLKILSHTEDLLENNRAALAAVESAIIDLVCRIHNISMWKYFGAKDREIKSDITVVIGSEQKAFEFTSQYAGKFDAFKIKIGKDKDEDIKRLLAVKKAAPSAKILLDANCSYTAAEAEKMIDTLIGMGIYPDFVEQPVKKEDIDGLAYLSRKDKVVICADESAYSLDDAFKIIKNRAANAINIKITKLGFMRAKEVYSLAKASGLKLMIGQMMESELSSFASAQFAGGLGNFDFVDLDSPFFIKNTPCNAGEKLTKNGIYRICDVDKGIGVIPNIA